ncbi:MAG: SHOCT domain-containing protein [Candidatus Rokuibacteriota bacterium]
MKVVWRAVTVAVSTLLPSWAAAQGRPDEWWWGVHPMGWMWGAWGIAMMLMMLVFWGLVIAGVVLGVRWLARQGGTSHQDEAIETLRRRYAKGEIDRDEFEAKRRDLER